MKSRHQREGSGEAGLLFGCDFDIRGSLFLIMFYH